MSARMTMAEGRYLVGPVLGRGGMATVYAAIDQQMGVVRAVKVMETAFLRSDQARERFQREARTMARVAHPHVLPVYDLVIEPHCCLIVCELAWHGSLRGRIDRAGPLPLADVALLGLQLLGALDAAHAVGVVHRDVKPSNILIDEHGRPRLADFGVVRVPDQGPALTRKGATLGTRAYMAPEQRADATGVDGRADLYALGRTLLKAALGHALDASQPLSGALEALPPRLALVIGQALHPDRDLRPASAAAMAEALARVAPELPLRPPETPPLADRPLDDLRRGLWNAGQDGSGPSSSWTEALTTAIPGLAGGE